MITSNLYAYVQGNLISNIDPTGLDTYRVNRDLRVMGNSAESMYNPLTHTFLATTNPDGSVDHTYSWGNDANLKGWSMDQPLDLKTAAEALKNGEAEKVGGIYLDPFVQKAFDDLNIPENEHANGIVYGNCKTEATNLTNKALDLMHSSWLHQH